MLRNRQVQSSLLEKMSAWAYPPCIAMTPADMKPDCWALSLESASGFWPCPHEESVSSKQLGACCSSQKSSIRPCDELPTLRGDASLTSGQQTGVIMMHSNAPALPNCARPRPCQRCCRQKTKGWAVCIAQVVQVRKDACIRCTCQPMTLGATLMTSITAALSGKRSRFD